MAWEEYSVQLLQASTTCFCLTRMTKLNIWINQQTDRPARKKVSTSQERGRERSTKTASTERTPRESVSKSDIGSIPPTPAPNKNQHQQSRFITGLNWFKFTNYWQPIISVAVLWCVLTRWPQGALTVTTANHIMAYSLNYFRACCGLIQIFTLQKSCQVHVRFFALVCVWELRLKFFLASKTIQTLF